MKKKIIVIILGLGLAGFLVAFFIENQKVAQYEKSIVQLPEVNLLDYALDKDAFYNKGSIDCFLIFNSECGFCLDEIEDIVDNIEDFETVNFYLVSNESEEVLKEYKEDSEFLGLENFTIIKDKDELFYNFFKTTTIPSVYVYSNDGALIDYNQGFLPIYELKSMIGEY